MTTDVPTNNDDRWACSVCASENIDGFQGHWACMDCGHEWEETDPADPPA